MNLLRRLLRQPRPDARAALLALVSRVLQVGHATNASGNNRSTR